MEYIDWKQKRIVTILSIILAVLSAAVLLVLASRYHESRTSADGAAIQMTDGAIVSQAAYTALTYRNETAELSFALNEAGTWIWADEPDFPLDPTAVTAIMDAISTLRPQQTLPAKEGEDYGFGEPRATLTATTAAGQTLTLVLGKTTSDGESDYMQVGGDESTVYIIPGALYQALQQPIYDMMRLPALPALAEAQLNNLTIQGTATTILSVKTEEDGSVTWRLGGKTVTGDATVAALTEDLGAWRLEKCVDYRPTDKAAEICGFTEPAAVLTVQSFTEGGADRTDVLTVGLPDPAGIGRYVRINNDDTIYLMATAYLDPLMRVAATGLA